MSQLKNKVYLGIGSNLGERSANIEKALLLLNENPNISVAQVSTIYETDPVGGPAQGKFLNGVIELRTDLNPLELLNYLQNIEEKLGRVRTGLKNQPRTLDLDILLFDDRVINTQQLIIPHALIQDRLFVLKPFADIAPEVIHPILKKTIKQIFRALSVVVNSR
ncbi:MAG: 2-amino-4-hydroxy-6-hydroxymethyldihydropteridine diphosphokinase [Candidatus Omnitrophota bacterium]